MSSDDDTANESKTTIAPFDIEQGHTDRLAQPTGSADPEVLEEGESTAGPGRPNGGREQCASTSNSTDDYFAKGADQEFQCTVRCCGGYTTQERRDKKDRLLPCFVNGPLCCRPAGVASARGVACCGQRFRCCSRVGNFTVLLERLQGPPHAPRRELWLVVGPYWPFCLALTTALMVVLPLVVLVLFWSVLPQAALLAFLSLTLLSLLALASVACRDPGLVAHVPVEPPDSVAAAARSASKWVYNDLTASWRPRRAQYDRDVNAVVREFDHVCPFTGTAVGGNNLVCFYAFVVAVQVLIYTSLAFLGWGLYTVYTDGYTPPPH